MSEENTELGSGLNFNADNFLSFFPAGLCG